MTGAVIPPETESPGNDFKETVKLQLDWFKENNEDEVWMKFKFY